MARKIAQYTVQDEGRDKGKLFLITEMSATKSEAWAMKVLLALVNGNVEVPDNFMDLGMAAMAEMGLKSLGSLRWEIAEPLLEELFSCVQIIPDPRKPQVIRALVESDTEEVLTRLKLRMEVWNLHVDFLQDAAPLILERAKAVAGNIRQRVTKTSPK